jgi:hypothetical protein
MGRPNSYLDTKLVLGLGIVNVAYILTLDIYFPLSIFTHNQNQQIKK